MTKPNFFIIGAPKCGTTALSEYLRSHPNIFMSQPKEPHYFAEDFNKYRKVTTLDTYLKLFEASKKHQHIAIGEASVFYLRSDIALKNIYSFNKDAKIIVMLRNHVDLVYSLHSHLYYNFEEGQEDFETAWNLQQQRSQGLKVPKTCQHKMLLKYAWIGKLGEQIENLFNVFPTDQIKVIMFDDFKTSTKTVYEEVLEFLSVPNDGKLEFPSINVNKSHKFRFISRFLEKPPQALTSRGKKLKKFLGISQFNIWTKLRQMNRDFLVKKPLRPPLSPNFRLELINEFRSDIEKLSQLIDKDLNHWLK